MTIKYLVATLHNMTPVPEGAIWRSDGVFDFVTEKHPVNIKEKLSEFDDKLNLVFKKKDFNIEGRADKLKLSPPKKLK